VSRDWEDLKISNATLDLKLHKKFGHAKISQAENWNRRRRRRAGNVSRV